MTTNKPVTVDGALFRGYMSGLVLPLIIAFVAMAFSYAYLSAFLHLGDAIAFSVGGVIGFTLGWLCRSYTITKWKIWAFTRVNEVRVLKKVALDQGLIFPEDHFLTRTEIRTSTDEQKLAELELKFLQSAQTFRDDPTVPPETIIYPSQVVKVLVIVISVAFVATGIFTFFAKGFNFNNIIMFLVVLVPAGWIFYQRYKTSVNRKTEMKIVLNNRGMSTPETGFWEWGQIRNEQIIVEESGRSRDISLQFELSGYDKQGKNSIKMSLLPEFKTTEGTFEYLLRIYRGRYEQKRNRNPL